MPRCLEDTVRKALVKSSLDSFLLILEAFEAVEDHDDAKPGLCAAAGRGGEQPA